MVSFSCEACSDVLTKKKLDSHRAHCHGASFTCLDCMVHFIGSNYRSHTSCISEAQKYQGALYKDKKSESSDSQALVPRKAYVEDDDEDYYDAITIVEPPPEAPSPPSAAPGFRNSPRDPVNVFDFYEGSETPNPSTLNLMEQRKTVEDTPTMHAIEERRTVWFEDEAILEEDADEGALVQYGSGPVATAEYRTPAPKADRDRKTRKDRDLTRDEKMDKKRKRLHVDTSAERSRSREVDEEMADAPPMLHSGLTGGLNKLLRNPTFPPSPDYSGDAAEPSPGSPLKRSKHAKRDRGREKSRRDNSTFGNGILSLITTRRSKKSSEDRVRKHKKRIREDPERASQKMIEYKPMNGDKDDQNGGQLVVYNGSARAELFLSLINKGPESENGCSMNKALKRYNRERVAMGLPHGKGHEEKELWRSLRMKRNDRGELVLFCGEK